MAQYRSRATAGRRVWATVLSVDARRTRNYRREETDETLFWADDPAVQCTVNKRTDDRPPSRNAFDSSSSPTGRDSVWAIARSKLSSSDHGTPTVSPTNAAPKSLFPSDAHRVQCRFGGSTLRKRSGPAKPVWGRHLAADPAVAGGQLCAKGTRVPVTVILDSLAEGASIKDVLCSYPTLTAHHVQAALAYAADLAREEEMTPMTAHAHQARREPSRRAG
jgi:uncharacterized protein (DUF433 family)